MRKSMPILLFTVLVFLAASASAKCKAKKSCKALNGSCVGKDEDCDGQAVEHKSFCKGSCKCCFKPEQKQCTEEPEPATTTSPGSPTTPGKEVKTIKPIIGILAQEMGESMQAIFTQYKSYIAAGYVKYFESAGARVVPIMIDQEDSYYEKLIPSLNGVFFPGGGRSITNSSGYGRAGSKIYDLVLESGEKGDPIPLMGICLGFQMINYLEAVRQHEKAKVLDECADLWDMSLPLDLEDGWKSSKLLGSAPDSVINPLKTQKITSNFHRNCVLPKTFEKYTLGKTFNIISTNKNKHGVKFISTIEHKTLPIWGLQWHIEKNPFEWKYKSIPHSPEAIEASHYFARLFGDYARQNGNEFKSWTHEINSLIYNYQPINLRPYKESHGYWSPFQQAYFFE